MYESFTQKNLVVHANFTTIDTSPSVVEDTDLNAYSGVLVKYDPSGLFTPFRFTSDGHIDSNGDIIVEVNNKAVNTNKQLQTVLKQYSSNEVITIVYRDRMEEVTSISVRIDDEGFVEVDEEEERKYFGKKSEDVDLELEETRTEWTPKQQLLRVLLLLLFALLLLVLLSGAILQIISLVLDITEVTNLISNLT